MIQLCFFISIAYSYCLETKPTIHYETVVERSTEMITRHEWLSFSAYPDTKWWSIGYWTRSFKWEVITQQEAYSRMLFIVSSSIHRIRKDFPEANEDQLVALTSIYYNCWSWYLAIKKEWFSIHKPWFCELKWYSGLLKRRQEERELLFKKNYAKD